MVQIHPLSDKYKILKVFPRIFWILLLALTILFRLWFLAVLIGLGILIFIILWIISIVAIGEIVNDSSTKRKHSKDSIWDWLWR